MLSDHQDMLTRKLKAAFKNYLTHVYARKQTGNCFPSLSLRTPAETGFAGVNVVTY